MTSPIADIVRATIAEPEQHEPAGTRDRATCASPACRDIPLTRRTLMGRISDYAIVCVPDGRFRLDRTTPPAPGPIAFAKPVHDRFGGQIGWKLHPVVVVQGSRSKIWGSAAEALASTQLLTAAEARRLANNDRAAAPAAEAGR
jgi:hypothetical protein